VSCWISQRTQVVAMSSDLKDDLRELIARLEERAQEVDEMGRASDIANAHANGVSCGLRFARDEVGQVLKEGDRDE